MLNDTYLKSVISSAKFQSLASHAYTLLQAAGDLEAFDIEGKEKVLGRLKELTNEKPVF